MRAISLWQPWASLWLTPHKIHETRHWKTNHRGRLYVHAAKRPIGEFDLDPRLEDLCIDEWGGHFRKDLPFGAVIGIVDLIDCVRTEAFETSAEDRLCGDFSPGRFGWRRKDYPIHIGPWPYKGHQGMWDIADLGMVANRALGIEEPT